MDLTALKKEAREKSTSASRLLELAKLDPQLSRAIAKRAAPLPAEVFEALARHSDMQTQRAVAAHPNAPGKLLEYLSGHGQWTVLKAIADNPNTPSDVLDKLSRHKRNTVREALAQRKGLPGEMIERFCTDLDPLVRKAMVKHPQTSREQLERFLSDSDPGVRTTLASLRKPRTFANDLLTDPDPQVRHETVIYCQYSALMPHLSNLASDPEEGVRVQIASRCKQPQLLAQLACDPSEEVRTQVAYNPFTPDETLSALAKGATTPIQYALSRNPFTPPAVLHDLAKVVPMERDMYAHQIPIQALLENPSTPPEGLRLLHQRRIPYFHEGNAWGQNPNWPAELLIQFAYSYAYSTSHDDENPQVRADWQEFTRIKDQLSHEQVLAWMLSCSIFYLNDAAASNRHTPGEAIARFVKIADPQVFGYTLEDIAKNPATPLQVLQSMAATDAGYLLKNPFLPDSILHTLAQNGAEGGEHDWHPYLHKAKGLLEVRQVRGIRVDDHSNITIHTAEDLIKPWK